MAAIKVLTSTIFDVQNSSYHRRPVESHPLKREFSNSSETTCSTVILPIMAENQSKKGISFEADKHLNYVPPERTYSMAEIGRQGQGISPNAVSVPFSLFTREAVMQMREEVLQKDVLENHQFSSNLAPCQLRGYASHLAPFIFEAWKSSEVLKIVSEIAGIEVVPVMDFEIGHINISINSKDTQAQSRQAIAELKSRQVDEGIAGCSYEEDKPIVDWHTDSYPFVAVVMLSDCSEMVGGETALRKGDGSVMKIRGPTMGHAVILQGRYIEHQALAAVGGAERITMVTSFRPKNPMIKDDTVLTTVRPISDLSELYGSYTEYRLKMLEERVRDQLERNGDGKNAGQRFDTAGNKKFITDQIGFLQSMLTEMVDEEDVIAGFTDSTHLLSDDLRSAHEVKSKAYLLRDG